MFPYFAALLSAVFGATSTLVIKCRTDRLDPTVVTAIQTIVMLFFSGFAAFVSGSFSALQHIGSIYIVYMVLSGISTGLSWYFYYHALREGDADKVMPIEKANIFLTVLIAITLFHERRFLVVKLIGVTVIVIGLLLLIGTAMQKSARNTARSSGNKPSHWLGSAVLSSVFAASNTIFSKLALDGMDSNFGTMLNTAVGLVVVLMMVAGQKKIRELVTVPFRDAVYVLLSGVSTAICWMLYYYGVKYGLMSAVAPLNKLSVPIVIWFSGHFLGTKITKTEGAGLTGIVTGMMLVAVFA